MEFYYLSNGAYASVKHIVTADWRDYTVTIYSGENVRTNEIKSEINAFTALRTVADPWIYLGDLSSLTSAKRIFNDYLNSDYFLSTDRGPEDFSSDLRQKETIFHMGAMLQRLITDGMVDLENFDPVGVQHLIISRYSAAYVEGIVDGSLQDGSGIFLYNQLLKDGFLKKQPEPEISSSKPKL